MKKQRANYTAPLGVNKEISYKIIRTAASWPARAASASVRGALIDDPGVVLHGDEGVSSGLVRP